MSSAGVLLCEPRGTLLFCRRTADGWWATPGGGIDPGESPRQAAIRELWEETRIGDVSDLHVLLVTEGFVLFGGYVECPALPWLDHEHDASGWFSPMRPPRPLHPGLRCLWRGYDRSFRPKPRERLRQFVGKHGP